MFDIPFLSISPTALILSIALHMLIGTLWYSSFMFGPLWLSLSKIKAGSLKMNSGHIVGSIATGATVAIVLSHLYKALAVHTCLASIQYSSLIWLGFIATVQFGAVLWENQPINLFLIKTAYWAVTLILTGCIVTKL